MSDGASYAVWYFSSTKNPWAGASKAHSAKKHAKKHKKYRKSRKLKRAERFGWAGH
jgi:hypothetical protein